MESGQLFVSTCSDHIHSDDEQSQFTAGVLVSSIVCLLAVMLFLSSDRSHSRRCSAEENEELNAVRKAKKLLRAHRYRESQKLLTKEASSSDRVTDNDGILTCDRTHTRRYRQLLRNTLFHENKMPIMRERAYRKALELTKKWSEESDDQLRDIIAHCLEGLLDVFIQMMIDPVGAVAISDEVRKEIDKQQIGEDRFIDICGSIDGSFVSTMRAGKHNDAAVKNMVLVLRNAMIHNTRPMLWCAILEAVSDSQLADTIWSDIDMHVVRGKCLREAIAASVKLRQLLQEALRWEVPVSSINRGEQYVSIKSFAHMSAVVGPEPEKFDAERFEKTKEGSPKFWPNLKFLPFGHGEHVCPGWKASVEPATQFIGVLLYNYTFTQEGDSLYCSKIKKRVPGGLRSSRM